jgi:hypothetical protein
MPCGIDLATVVSLTAGKIVAGFDFPSQHGG